MLFSDFLGWLEQGGFTYYIYEQEDYIASVFCSANGADFEIQFSLRGEDCRKIRITGMYIYRRVNTYQV